MCLMFFSLEPLHMAFYKIDNGISNQNHHYNMIRPECHSYVLGIGLGTNTLSVKMYTSM